ncbi:DUF1217 domain-containing protein [Litorisediminicola beolgyonensis]|uniref:DUF1217 domain-containing protein n=1 Tax=Litorisediminicola beolgyonensis TaxID=1173614 RepID=A0ABW3ZG89_9RHOB
MSYQPIIVGSGLAGWRFLNATLQAQKGAFDSSGQITRRTSYFSEKIREIRSAEGLVSDRGLRSVALEAYGLDQDLENRFFIQKILESDLTDSGSLANRLADDRYKKFAAAFGFAQPLGSGVRQPVSVGSILSRFRAHAFETAVGEQSPALRLALHAERTLPELTAEGSSENATWFRIMGTPPLRTVFETAFGLPKAFGQLDLDRQLATFRDRSEKTFGSSDPAKLAEPATLGRLIDRFLLRDQMSDLSAARPAQIALSLLKAAPKPARL